jgi:hypothetical protein
MDRRPSPDPDQIRENPPCRVPILLDPAQLAAATATLEFAIVHGRQSVESVTMRRLYSSDSDTDSRSSHDDDRHHCYPLVQSLDVGDVRFFSLYGSAGSVPELTDAPQGHGLYRYVCPSPPILPTYSLTRFCTDQSIRGHMIFRSFFV